MAAVGDIVHITAQASAAHAGTYVIIKVNPTTYRLRREGDGALLRATHSYVQPGPLPQNGATSITAIRDEEHFDTGSVVTARITGVDPAQLWVVTGETAKGYRIYPLGGSRRYYTGIPSSRLTRVTSIKEWTA
jgi:hypothetical protein